MGGAELYAGNTAAMWASLAPWSRVTSGAAPGLLAVDIPAQRAARIILRQPLAAGAGQIGALMRRAADAEALAQAEQVMVDGFPRRALQPFRPGCMLPPLVLAIPGWQTWLAYRDGKPAAACCAFDDGAALGIYWLSTLPQHRSHGLGRAVMYAALGSRARRPVVLVATEAGEPLYDSLGFRTVTEAAWYRSPGQGNGADRLREPGAPH